MSKQSLLSKTYRGSAHHVSVRGSLHEPGLSFTPERHFEFNPFLHERLDRGLKYRGKSKSYSGLKIISDLCTDPLIVSAILALIHLST